LSGAVYRLDTGVVQELRRPRLQPAVIFWIDDVAGADLNWYTVTTGGVELNDPAGASSA